MHKDLKTRLKLIFEYTPQSGLVHGSQIVSLVGLQLAGVELFGVNGNLGK